MKHFQALKAVILDWSGTTLDFGSIAPVRAFQETFKHYGIMVSAHQARIPMGKYKRDHIAQILAMPDISSQWQTHYSRLPDEADLGNLYAHFVPLQTQIITEYAVLIPGVREVVSQLSAEGLKIGACTGYTRAMMQQLIPLAQDQGYLPEVTVCPDDVGAGRPYPWMIYEVMRRLEVFPPHGLVKIGDTIADIAEGRNAGTWTIGLAVSGNEVGLHLKDWMALSFNQQQQLRAVAENRLFQAGAHYVVDSLDMTLECLIDIERRIRQGERP